MDTALTLLSYENLSPILRKSWDFVVRCAEATKQKRRQYPFPVIGVPKRESATVVYRIYGKNNELLYVGSTSFLRHRLRRQRQKQSWWKEMVRIDIEEFENINLARRQEWYEIKTLQPKYNQKGKGKKL